MINERKSDFLPILKHAKNYFGANLANKALGLISIPLFTRLLTPAEYGIINIYNSYIAMTVVLLTLNAHAMIGRYYYEEKEDFNEFLGTTIFLSAALFLCTSLIYLVFIQKLHELSKLSPELLGLILLATFLTVISSAYYQIMAARQESKQLAVNTVIQNYCGFLISILLIYIIEHGKYLGLVYGTLISSGIMSLFYAKKLLEYTKFVFRLKHCAYIIRNSFPLIPYSLSGVILAYIDRIMIGQASLSDAGLYSFSYNIAMLLTLVSSAMQTAFMPNFFSLMNNRDYQPLYRTEKNIFSVTMFCALGLILYAKELVWILGDDKYHSAIGVIPPVVIGMIFLALFDVYGKYIGYCNKNVWSSVILLSSGIINILLNYHFLPIYGYVAAAYTTAVSYFIMVLFTWLVTKYILAMPIMPLHLYLKTTSAFCILGGLFLILSALIREYWLIFLLKTVLLSVFLLFIMPTRNFLTNLKLTGGR